MYARSCSLLILSCLLACSKSSDSSKFERYEYGLSTAKEVAYPAGTTIYLGDELLGTLGPMHEGLQRHQLSFEQAPDAPLSVVLGTGLVARWQSPCGIQESKLVPEEGMDVALSYLKEHEASQKKHGGRAGLDLMQSSPHAWASKATYIWADIKADKGELKIGEMVAPIAKGEPTLAFGLDCAPSHQVQLEGTTASLSSTALAASRDYEWDERILGRYAFIGQKDQCYTLRELVYTSDSQPTLPRTTSLQGGQVHILTDEIHYFLEDAPDGVEIAIPVDEAGLHDSVTHYELKTAACAGKADDSQPSCFDSCRSSGGTKGECKTVCQGQP